MSRLLFVHPDPEPSGFVAQDLAILRRRFEVATFRWRGPRDLARLRSEMKAHDGVFTWFLSHHAAACALAARLTGRASVAVTSSEEVTPPAEIGEPPWRLRDRLATTYAVRATDLVLAGSRCTLREASALRGRRGRSELRYLPLGVDTDRFHPGGPREDLVVSACVMTEASARRKRIPLVLEAARLVPEARFVVPGKHHDGTGARLAAAAPPNVSIPGALPAGDYEGLLRRAKVYVQVSVHEGFGISNAEAMASGCVPVVSNGGALPEVVGDAGFYVDPPTPERLASAIREALSSSLGSRARARVLAHHDLKERAVALVAAVESALGDAPAPGRGP